MTNHSITQHFSRLMPEVMSMSHNGAASICAIRLRGSDHKPLQQAGRAISAMTRRKACHCIVCTDKISMLWNLDQNYPPAELDNKLKVERNRELRPVEQWQFGQQWCFSGKIEAQCKIWYRIRNANTDETHRWLNRLLLPEEKTVL